jgi:rod shape determining protein RodA
MVIGILFIYSSGINSSGELVSNEYIKQIVWASAGLAAALVLSMVNYRRLYNFSPYLYLIVLIPLVYTMIFGRMAHSTRWLRIGIFGIQVSELAKYTTIIFLARYLSDTGKSNNSFVRFIVSCLIVLVPMGIILIQPDLGTSLVFIPILLTMVFMAGIPLRYVLFSVSCIVVTGILTVLPLWQTHILRRSVPIMGMLTNLRLIIIVIIALSIIMGIALFGYLKFRKRYFFWMLFTAAILVFSLGASYGTRMMLKNYQLMRLIIFLDPNIEPRGAGWNIIQSVTAIGAGGLTGQGYLQGTQSHYRYLPEQIYAAKGSGVIFIMFKILKQIIKNRIKTATPPTKPISSEKIEKIKSVLCSGR